MPNPKKQQKEAHKLGEGVKKRLIDDYRETVIEAEKRIVDLTLKANGARVNGIPVSPSWVYQQQGYKAMVSQIQSELTKLNTTTSQEIQGAKRQAVNLAQEHITEYVGSNYKSLQASAVEELVRTIHNSRPGTTYGKAMARLPAGGAKKAERALVQAIALGDGPAAASARLRREMGGNLNQYMTLARTEIMGAYTTASLKGYKENEDLIGGWEWIVEDDADLCEYCQSMATKTYKVGDPFDAHPNCRCTTAPLLKEDIEPHPDPEPEPEPAPPPPPVVEVPTIDIAPKPFMTFKQRLASEYVRPGKAIRELREKIGQLGPPRGEGYGWISARADAHLMLAIDKKRRGTISHSQQGGYASPITAEKAREALAWMESTVDKNMYRKNPIVSRIDQPGTRAYYNMRGTMVLDPKDNADIYVHEAGHWLEDKNKAGLRQSLGFIETRVGDEKPRKLSDITGNPGYRDDEKARPDAFISPYVGKSYGSSASEVVSMGMEEMYRDPVGFARRDPEHFEHTLNFMRGKAGKADKETP